MHWLKQTDKHKDRTSSKKTYFKPRIVKNTNTTQSPDTKNVSMYVKLLQFGTLALPSFMLTP